MDSLSSSPEPYMQRRRSRERPRSRASFDESSGHKRRSYRGRQSPVHGGSKRYRSESPHRPSKRHRRHSRRPVQGEASYEDGELQVERFKSYKSRHGPRADGSRQHPDRIGEVERRHVKGSRPLPSQAAAFKGEVIEAISAPSQTGKTEKRQKPNFSATGRLAAESNTVKSSGGEAIVLKYHEPPEARKPPPNQAWRMYVFKGSDIVDTVELSERTCWLFGRESAVVDCLTEHPSCSKQHAVVQFRHVEKKSEFGDKMGKVKPYLIDLESANGTHLNRDGVPAGRYLELRNKDVVKFGHSTREYLLQLPP